MKNKKNIKIGIAVSEFNKNITKSLLNCCVRELKRNGILEKNIKVLWVPGAFELPFSAQLLSRKKYDAIICLGCILKGQTSHDIHIADWVSHGIGLVSLKTNIPVLFGVLTPKTEAQGLKRASRGAFDRGKEVAQSALRMIEIKKGKEL